MQRSFLIVLSLIVSCSTPPKPLLTDQVFLRQPGSSERDSRIATGKKGMVVAAHPLASKAGLQILQEGGNAADAAVAVSFVISVVRPQSTGIGGGGFLLYHDTKQPQTTAYDFRETAPSKAQPDMFLNANGSPKDFFYKGKRIRNASVNGHLSVGVPGLVHGVWEVHQKHGKLPWKRLLQPAIKIARDGFPIYPSLARAIARRQKVMTMFPSSRAIFFPSGKPLQAGELLVQTDLAKTLEAIANDGTKPFYQGWIAEKIIQEMKEGKGLITAQDMKNYQTKVRRPIDSQFKNIRLVSMPPPSSGGVHIAQILNILEGYDLSNYTFQSPKYINLLVEAMRFAYADRAMHLGDPDFYKVPIAGLTSKQYAAALRAKIAPGKAGNSELIGPGDPAPYESPSTTHFSIVDSSGNAVSSTQTINISFGSGVVAQGTGIVLNDEMDDFSKKPATPNAFGLIGYEANKVMANKRMLSSMSPTLVFENGRLSAVVGSPGGSRIITATLQTILNRFVFNMSPQDAVHASRLHHQWKPDKVFIEENSLKPTTIDTLKAMGYQVQPTKWPVGDVQAVFRTDHGWIGVSDTRSDGQPFGL